MVTKFITIRIPVPSFGRRKEIDDETEALAKRLEFDTKIRDIDRRIKKLRAHFDTPRRVRVESAPKVDEPTRKADKGNDKNAELDEIKRKLMGGKK